MTQRPDALKFLYPGWYAMPMGLCGLSLAWHRAAPLMGDMAEGISLVLGLVAASVLGLLLLATLTRLARHPEAWAEDCKHPVRHTFVATLPLSLMLLATVAVGLLGPHPVSRALWWVGSVSQMGVTWWVMARWWQGNKAGGLQWASITPALFIPVVGNVLAPLAGVPLGHSDWAAAQYGVGLMFWPVALVLLLVRIAAQGMFPDRLLPTVFIVIVPPTLAGLGALQLGAPLAVGWACWGMALFSFFWASSQAGRIRDLPFGMAHWGMSFPLTAFAAFTLRLAEPGSVLAVAGPVLLALASLVILALAMGTVRGLRDGSLLAPEPVAQIVPAAA